MEQCLRKRADIRLHGELRCCQTSDDLPLAGTLNLAIAEKGRQYLVMPEVLDTALAAIVAFGPVRLVACRRLWPHSPAIAFAPVRILPCTMIVVYLQAPVTRTVAKKVSAKSV